MKYQQKLKKIVYFYATVEADSKDEAETKISVGDFEETEIRTDYEIDNNDIYIV